MWDTHQPIAFPLLLTVLLLEEITTDIEGEASLAFLGDTNFFYPYLGGTKLLHIYAQH
jgi:hypothetical protein